MTPASRSSESKHVSSLLLFLFESTAYQIDYMPLHLLSGLACSGSRSLPCQLCSTISLLRLWAPSFTTSSSIRLGIIIEAAIFHFQESPSERSKTWGFI